ncbi:MAG: hypothetical protein OXB90_12000 [Acidimicrobiaceae bacterium]|nr:hypothetical protein [Acidimicrobiaceae bacterium]
MASDVGRRPPQNPRRRLAGPQKPQHRQIPTQTPNPPTRQTPERLARQASKKLTGQVLNTLNPPSNAKSQISHLAVIVDRCISYPAADRGICPPREN